MVQGTKITEDISLVGSEDLSGAGDCHVYAFRYAPHKICLIDAGVNSATQIITNIGDSFSPQFEITHLILTHCHIDHIGAAHEFKRKFPALTIMAHTWDAASIEGLKGTEKTTAASWYGITYIPVKITQKFDKDEEVIKIGDKRLRIYHTPGHTPGSISVVYEDPQAGKILFGQDIHGPFMPEFNSNLRDWHASMKRLLALEPDILCEGHFGIIKGKDNVRRFIKTYLQQHRE